MNPLLASRITRLVASFALASVAAFAPAAALAFCGDGNVETEEQCDDGNNESGDCCAFDCTFEEVESFCTDNNECTFDFCDGQGSCVSFPTEQAECDDGNDCTVGDFCQEGFCVSEGQRENGDFCNDSSYCGGGGQCFFGTCFGDPADCTNAGGVCNSGICNPDTFRCEFTQLENGTPCDNPSSCTDPGVCENGECQQPPTDCSHLEDACNEARCDVEAGGCFTVWRENGTPCDDTNGCTLPGSCDDGECLTEPKDCSSFADQCNDAGCDPKTEEGCFQIPKDDGTECDDDLICTTGDVCTEGTCDGTPVDCSEAGDDCNIGFCNPQTGECATTPVEGPTNCDDGDPCTEGDQCIGGLCIGQPKDCSSFDTACTIGVCSLRTGECRAQDVEDGTECDDGDKCTLDDGCDNGECTGTPLDCSELDGECVEGFCNGDTGGCESQPASGPCSDGDPCTVGEACSDGECVGGDPKDCSSADAPCREGTCNGRTGACEGVPVEDGTTCSDGDLCTVGDECTEGTCEGSPKDCSASGGNCRIGECNPDTGQCVGEDAPDGTTCTDGNACTTGDECADGICVGDAVTCPPATAECQESFCNPDSGQCQNRDEQDGTTCDDGDACTTGDDCTNGACSGNAVDCSNLTDACNTGSCSANTGACVKVPRENGTGCSDSDACTVGDACDDGVCESGTPRDCSSLDAPCRTGVCDTKSGDCEAVNADNGTSCSDGAFCTATDTCTNGVCSGTGDPCPGTAICNGTCDETRDTCNAVAGTPCESDDNPCTDDVCDGQGACADEANEASCDDGLYCTTGDHCADKACVGEATCPQTSTCGDTCDEVADACRTCGKPFSNTRCIVNAIFVLQGALGLRDCEPCMCDVDSSGVVTATDALMILRTCTFLPTNLECPSPNGTTTTTFATTTTIDEGCLGELHDVTFNQKYTCAQTNEGGDPFCADQNELDTIRFTHEGGGFYEVRDVPDSGFVYQGIYDCTTFTWNATSAEGYSEGGVWTFNDDSSQFSGSSAYVADDLSYAGACNQTGAESPATPPDPTPVAPCD